MLGLLLLVGGLAGTFLSCLFLFNDFASRMSVEAYQSMGPSTNILCTTKVIASLIALITGIYVLWNRNNTEKIKAVHERLWMAEMIYLFGLLSFVVGCVFNLNTIGLALSGFIGNTFCLVSLPFLWGSASALRQVLEDNSGRIKLTVMLALSSLTTVGSLAFIAYMTLTQNH